MRKPRSFKAMREYLKSHFRYNTMNSWNQATSFAAKVKVHDFIEERSVLDKAYNFLDVEESYDDVRYLLDEFAKRHGFRFQIGFNGRSSGYLVLYRGEIKQADYKTRCDHCGINTWYEEEQKCHKCSVGTLRILESPAFTVYTFPGKSIGEDLDEMDDCCLEGLFDVVWDFDKTVEAAKRAFIEYVKSHDIEEQTIMVPKKVKVAV